MVQRNRDIEQDVKDICSTREALTEKIDMLRRRVDAAVWHTKDQVVRPINKVQTILDGVRKVYTRSDQHVGYFLTLTAAMIAFIYLRHRRERLLKTKRSHAARPKKAKLERMA